MSQVDLDKGDFSVSYEFGVEHVVFPSCTVMYEDFGKPIKEEDLVP